jgi:hypothetical protein
MIQMKRLFMLFLAFFICATIHATSFPQPVQIDTGAVMGIPGHFDSVTAFLGIPYAAAPVGVSRWKAPVLASTNSQSIIVLSIPSGQPNGTAGEWGFATTHSYFSVQQKRTTGRNHNDREFPV